MSYKKDNITSNETHLRSSTENYITYKAPVCEECAGALLIYDDEWHIMDLVEQQHLAERG